MDAIVPGLIKASSTCAVIGSGPNGLAGAVRMAQEGYAVTVYEAQEQMGGGCVSLPLTLPGYIHDHCSAIHPLGIGSGYFRTLPLAEHGLEWIQPDAPLAHPLDDGTAAVLHRSIASTAYTLGEDANAYARLFTPIVPRDWSETSEAMLHPVLAAKHPIGLARFGLPALLSAQALAERRFRGEHARALFAGCAAHSFLPLEESPQRRIRHRADGARPRGRLAAAAWRVAEDRRQFGRRAANIRRRSSPLGAGLRRLKNWTVSMLSWLMSARRICCNSPENACRRFISLSWKRFSPDPACLRWIMPSTDQSPGRPRSACWPGRCISGARSTRSPPRKRRWRAGSIRATPMFLLAQQSLFDPTRAPAGKHTVWAYCHVPQYSNKDQSETITPADRAVRSGLRE